MSEFIIRDAESTAHVNEHGTTVTIDRTETFDTRTEAGEFVLRWFTVQHGFDRRGERKDDEYAAEVELLRVGREAARWLRGELDNYVAEMDRAAMLAILECQAAVIARDQR